MTHQHSVYDNDTHFKIDPITRAIENTSGKTVLMQNDHNSERFTFEIPREIDGHDMSKCNTVEVHYINIDAATHGKNADVYPVTDLQISPDSEDVVICSWLISQNATKYAGKLCFALRYACLAEDETIEYQWFSGVYDGIKVGESYFNGEAVIEEYSDILQVWMNGLGAGFCATMNAKVAEMEASANARLDAKMNARLEKMDAILENFVFTNEVTI